MISVINFNFEINTDIENAVMFARQSLFPDIKEFTEEFKVK